MSAELEVGGLDALCPEARRMEEAGCKYIYLPGLKVKVGSEVKTLDALLCLSAHSGYPTRLFLACAVIERPTIAGKPANWSQHSILGRNWWSWSWTGVPADLPAPQVLLAHVKALQ